MSEHQCQSLHRYTEDTWSLPLHRGSHNSSTSGVPIPISYQDWVTGDRGTNLATTPISWRALKPAAQLPKMSGLTKVPLMLYSNLHQPITGQGPQGNQRTSGDSLVVESNAENPLRSWRLAPGPHPSLRFQRSCQRQPPLIHPPTSWRVQPRRGPA